MGLVASPRIPGAFLALLLACQPAPAGTAQADTPLAAHEPSAVALGVPSDAHVRLESAVPSGWPLPLSSPVVHTDRFLVVSDSPLATRAGVAVLDRGGNAFDAAVSVALVLSVVYPEAGNLGGGGFAVVRDHTGQHAALDFRETAPEQAHRDMYRDGAASPSRGSSQAASSKEGHLSSGVPGSVAGLWALHQRFGSLPWPELIAPAIGLAHDGFVVDARLARALADAAPKLVRFDATRAWLLPDGKPAREGSRLVNTALARTLERIAERGPAGFYAGPTAALISAEMQRGGGLVSLADLEHYRPEWRTPIEFEYRGHTLVSMPPPSSGGVALALIANIAQGDDLSRLGYHSPEHLHLLAEAMRRAFADRNTLLGDPAFVRVPLGPLLSPEYARERRRSITARATPSSEVGPGLPRPEGEHTTHIAVVDAEGAAVSLTTTLNDFFGSGVTVSGAGFLLNDEMDDFATDPGTPNLYGLVQGEANAIAPGKRMLSSMAPTLLLDAEGEVRAVAGARGGPRIITATWQVLSNIVDFGMNALEAVNAPRLHQQWQPDEIALEQAGFTPEQTVGLEKRGHHLRFVPDLASSPVIVRDAVTHQWTGAADPRRGGEAAGR
ncbi:MAG TPA: gamma-glutamyltransferase [Polyangiaceae bacterium]|nr:gamma-glutamyltransferase [Polyangiaceae bacterium]